MDPVISKLMDRSSLVELKVAQIYDTLSRTFHGHAALSSFWTLFAEAERYHSLILQMQKHLIDPRAVSHEAIEAWKVDVDKMLAFLESQIERLEHGWTPSVAEAFTLADYIENQVAEAQTHSFKMVDDSDIGDLLSKLHDEDLRHRAKLLEARSRFDPTYPGGTAGQGL